MNFYTKLIQEEDMEGEFFDSEIEAFLPISGSAENSVQESDHGDEKIFKTVNTVTIPVALSE